MVHSSTLCTLFLRLLEHMQADIQAGRETDIQNDRETGSADRQAESREMMMMMRMIMMRYIAQSLHAIVACSVRSVG